MRLRRLLDGLVLMIFLAAAAICVSLYSRGRAELKAAVIKHQTAAERVDQLRLQTERLEQEVKRLRTDAREIESLARQNLGLVRAGDIVIKINQSQKDSAASAVVTRIANLTPPRSESYIKY